MKGVWCIFAAALFGFMGQSSTADTALLYSTEKAPQTSAGLEEIYAGLPSGDSLHVVDMETQPVELASLFIELSERNRPQKPKIKIYAPDLPKGQPAPAESILDYIAQFEASPDAYNSVWAGNRTPLPRSPTAMTICEIKDWQKKAARRQKSTAIGRYQFISETFARITDKLGLRCDALFSEEIQDQMAMALLVEAGWTQFVSGHTGVSQFGHALAGVWAAFPATRGIDRGKSRYWRIAGNRSLVGLGDYLADLGKIRSHHNRKERQVYAGAL